MDNQQVGPRKRLGQGSSVSSQRRLGQKSAPPQKRAGPERGRRKRKNKSRSQTQRRRKQRPSRRKPNRLLPRRRNLRGKRGNLSRPRLRCRPRGRSLKAVICILEPLLPCRFSSARYCCRAVRRGYRRPSLFGPLPPSISTNRSTRGALGLRLGAACRSREGSMRWRSLAPSPTPALTPVSSFQPMRDKRGLRTPGYLSPVSSASLWWENRCSPGRSRQACSFPKTAAALGSSWPVA